MVWCALSLSLSLLFQLVVAFRSQVGPSWCLCLWVYEVCGGRGRSRLRYNMLGVWVFFGVCVSPLLVTLGTILLRLIQTWFGYINIWVFFCDECFFFFFVIILVGFACGRNMIHLLFEWIWGTVVVRVSKRWQLSLVVCYWTREGLGWVVIFGSKMGVYELCEWALEITLQNACRLDVL